MVKRFWAVLSANGDGGNRADTFEGADKMAQNLASNNPDITFHIMESVGYYTSQPTFGDKYEGEQTP